jgi:hypothetical protein
MKKAVMTAMAVLVALVWFGSQQQAQSAPVLDQSFDSAGGDQSFAAITGRPLCQTFTANMTGYLVGVSLLMHSAATNDRPATISILATSDGVPVNTVLWTSSEYTSLADGWFDVNITSGAPAIIAGTVYGIRLESTLSSVNSDSWLTTTTGTYSGGKMYEDRGSGWVSVSTSPTSYPNADGGFRTYVDAVPEPATVSLMILALSLTVVMTLRHRRPV